MADQAFLEELRLRLRFARPGRRRLRLRRPPRWLPPDGIQRRFGRLLDAYLQTIQRAVESIYFPRLEAIAEAAGRQRQDSWVDDLDRLANALRTRVLEGREGRIRVLEGVAADIGEWNGGQWRRILRGVLGVDVFASEPWLQDELRSWAREGGALITTLEDDAIRQVEALAQRAVRGGQRHTDIAKQIEARLGTSRRRAQLLARDQTKKLNGRLTEERQRKAGVSMYIWRTSRDERVRGNPSGKYPDAKPSHHVLDGKYCRWDDPTVYAESPDGPWKSRASIGAVEEHPGQPINDRCTAEPVLITLLEALK